MFDALDKAALAEAAAEAAQDNLIIAQIKAVLGRIYFYKMSSEEEKDDKKKERFEKAAEFYANFSKLVVEEMKKDNQSSGDD